MTNRWAILALIMGAQTMANVGPLGIPAIAPLIRDSLGLSMTQAGSFLSAYYVGAALMSLPAGWMADRWGVASTMVAGQGVIALGLFTVSGSGSFGALIAIMILAGTGYGMLNPTTAKAVMSWFPRRQRATVVGLKQVGLPLGGAVGALLMPPLALWLGWRVAVALSASLIALLAGLTWLCYRDPPRSELETPARQEGSMRAVLRNRDLWLVSTTTLVFAGMQTVWMAFLVLYLQETVRVPLVTAAGYLVMAQVTGMIGRVAFGLLSDRHFGGRRRIVLVIAGVGSTVCSLLMAATGPGSSAWVLAPLALCFGFFGIGWNGVQHTLMAELAGPRAAGTALGLGLAVSSLGVSMWPPLFGLLVEQAGGFGVPWTVLGLAMAGALCLLLPVREGRMDVP
ncbi:MAG: MFS transporter [Candidatus Rokubacteria bacterium]|nr:MFS transporter [Candidatus Rokubacteria bacterium]